MWQRAQEHTYVGIAVTQWDCTLVDKAVLSRPQANVYGRAPPVSCKSTSTAGLRISYTLEIHRVITFAVEIQFQIRV